MLIINDLRQLHKVAKACVIALGTFDGLHLGHQQVIQTAKAEAAQRQALLAVFTFSNHPLQLIRPESVPQALLTKEQKYQLLEQMGVELLVDLPFNWELANLSPLSFIDKLELLGTCCIVVGENFTFGCKGVGNCNLLSSEAAKRGLGLRVLPLVTDKQQIVCSTLIRKLLAEGEVETAATYLGRYYALTGVVSHGQERGRLLGFPTANIELANSRTAVPPTGVYAVRVRLANGETYGGMANIGNNPTFGDVLVTRLEAHLFDYKGDLYDQALTIEFVARIRPQIKFASLEALVAQLKADKQSCLARL